MKIFQIVNEICFWDASYKYNSVDETVGLYPPDVVFVEAPDNVFEGWGYIDGKFIPPEPPEGFLYDPFTGTFYLENSAPPKPPKTLEELERENKLLKAQLQAQSDRADFIEDCIAEMAMQVYN